jgi:hypothetical protein
MSTKITAVVFSLFLLLIGCAQASAQGGWRQWEIRFLDGTSVEASPLQLRKDGRFTRSMDPDEAGYLRSTIDYFAATRHELPPAPMGKFKQDLVVMLDGKRYFGAVKFVELSFSEGKFIQNGKQMSLENVAYIKFAHLKRIAPQKKQQKRVPG